MTSAAYHAIQKRSTVGETREALRTDQTPPGVLYFSRVSPDLFQNIVHSFHGGAFGRMSGSGSTNAEAAKPE